MIRGTGSSGVRRRRTTAIQMTTIPNRIFTIIRMQRGSGAGSKSMAGACAKRARNITTKSLSMQA